MSKSTTTKSTGATTARKSPGPASRARKTRPDIARPAADGRPVDAPAPPRTSQNILSAGIKALANAHGEVVARQSRVFESLLGLGRDASGTHGDPGERSSGTGDKPVPGTALDPFGFKKFEDVFDQRVARTLQRLGVPSAQAFADLTSEVEHLREQLARLQTPGRKR